MCITKPENICRGVLAERQNRHHDTIYRAATTAYKVGDLVYCIDETSAIGKSPKLQKK